MASRGGRRLPQAFAGPAFSGAARVIIFDLPRRRKAKRLCTKGMHADHLSRLALSVATISLRTTCRPTNFVRTFGFQAAAASARSREEKCDAAEVRSEISQRAFRLVPDSFDRTQFVRYYCFAGWSSLVARRAHNPEVVGSNPTPATMGAERETSKCPFYFQLQADPQ